MNKVKKEINGIMKNYVKGRKEIGRKNMINLNSTMPINPPNI
jgi:hypothetical protein